MTWNLKNSPWLICAIGIDAYVYMASARGMSTVRSLPCPMRSLPAKGGKRSCSALAINTTTTTSTTMRTTSSTKNFRFPASTQPNMPASACWCFIPLSSCDASRWLMTSRAPTQRNITASTVQFLWCHRKIFAGIEGPSCRGNTDRAWTDKAIKQRHLAYILLFSIKLDRKYALILFNTECGMYVILAFRFKGGGASRPSRVMQ